MSLQIWPGRSPSNLALPSLLAIALSVVPSLAQAAQPPSTEAPPPRQISANPPLAHSGGPLSLEQLLDLAREHNPEMRIAYARAAAARGQLIQAGLYPNPTFIWEADDLGHRPRAAGTQGPIIAQEFITAKKLQLAQAAAGYGVAAADWHAVTRWYDLTTRVRIAYFNVLTAQREVRTLVEIVRITEEGLDAAEKLLKAGTGTKPDVLRAQVELKKTRLDLAVARQRVLASWRILASAIGLPTVAETSLMGMLESEPPTFLWEPARATLLMRSSEVQEAQALAMQADWRLRRAHAEVVPNFQLSVRPFYSFPDRTTQVKVEAGAALPIFNRNQGNIMAARADLARTQAEVQQVELRLAERLAQALQRYDIARRQVEAYQKEILPDARESLRLVTVGYKGGDAKYDYTAVLQQQRILVDAQLASVQALGELWRAVSEIAGLLQLDDISGAAPPK